LTFPEHRRWFVAAHGAVRAILARHLDVPPDEIGWAYGPHGKPELAGALAPARCGPHVSLSHSDGVALLAVAARRVGVDIQRLPPRFDATGMALRYFPRAEAQYVAAAGESAAQIRRFIGLWARKEACVKVAGGRLMQGMALPVRAADGPGRTGVVVHQPAAPVTGPYLVRDLAAPSGFRAAVAVEGAQGYGIARHRWRPPLTPP
jgi:4'-phosphopantetheinyl transferase